MSGEAIREAVELAAIVQDCATLPPALVAEAIRGALTNDPIRALTGQAALTGGLARLAEERVAALLADPELLQVAMMRAEQGVPLSAEAVGISRGALLREAGLAAARLR